MFSDLNKPTLVRSNMPFGFDESPLDIQELLKFRDKFNGDLNASLMDIKIGWKNHYSWRPDFAWSATTPKTIDRKGCGGVPKSHNASHGF